MSLLLFFGMTGITFYKGSARINTSVLDGSVLQVSEVSPSGQIYFHRFATNLVSNLTTVIKHMFRYHL